MDIIVTRARRIYADGKHNAFTGICRHRDRTFVTFRSGVNHVTPGSTIKVIAASDLEKWSVAAEKGTVSPTIDNRDPKVASFAGRLLVYYPEITRGEERLTRGMLFTSEDGEHFSEPRPVEGLPESMWLWWFRPWEGKLYGAGYARGRRLLAVSDDGVRWRVLIDLPVEAGNENSFDFDPDGTLWALVREDSFGSIPTVCVLKPPYTEVEQKFRLPMELKGPMLKRLPGGSVIICRQWDTRSGHKRNTRTEIFWLPDGDPLQYVSTLPSGGDTSYAGWLDTAPGRAVVSYYSSHEYRMAVPPDHPDLKRDSAIAEHSSPADIFLADICYVP
jgi:hypothetical protein